MSTWNSDSLFPQTNLPCRCWFVLVEDDRLKGNQEKNPLEFRRIWKERDDDGNVTKMSYVKNIELKLNGKSLGSLDGGEDANAEGSLMNFFRLCHFNGKDQKSPFSMGIELNDFNTSYFIGVYDLSTGNSCDDGFLVPSIRIGHCRITINFSAPTLQELNLLVLAEYPSLMSISYQGKISVSYHA